MKSKEKILTNLFELTNVSKFQFLLLAIFILIGTGIGLLQPMFIGRIIDGFVNSDSNKVLSIIIEMCLLFVLSLIVTLFKDKIAVKIAVQSENVIREKVIRSILKKEIDVETGKVLTNLEEDSKVLSTVIFQHLDILIDSVSILFTFVLMFTINVKLTSFLLFLIPIQFLILLIFSRVFTKKEKLIKREKELYLNHATETILGRRTVNLFEKQIERLYEFSNIVKLFGKYRTSYFLTQTYQSMILQSIFFTYNIIVIFWGMTLINNGDITIGLFITFTTYSNSILTSGLSISELNSAYQSVKLSVLRLLENIQDDDDAELSVLNDIGEIREVELSQISYSYANNEIFKDFSTHFTQGNLYVVQSPSGKGKTTLFNIISGLYPIDKGVIFANKKRISSIPKENIAYMTQTSYIFTMSILENLRFYNPNLELEEIIKICDILKISESVEKLENGYHTILNPSKPQLSGGQIQRICLARVLLRKSDIYLLDEPLSNLDNNTKEKVFSYLKKVSEQAIVIMNSHDNHFLNEDVTLIELV